MAPAIGEKGGRLRVFVLVDKGAVKGVFLSWDAAESYADEHHLPLDHLFEYVTRHDHPDHLHLLVAEWDHGWIFQGEWKRETPRWKRPPKQVRLDHYHLRGHAFRILRQKEFLWSTGLLLKIDPMAPDMILDQIASKTPITPTKQWRPKLGALKGHPPVVKKPEQTEKSITFPDSLHPKQGKEHIPLITEPESLLGTLSNPEQSPKPAIKPALDRAPVVKPRLAQNKEKSTEPTDTGPLPLEDKPKISYPKRKPLKLRSKAAPHPIPKFEPSSTSTLLPSTHSSVELAQKDQSKNLSGENSEDPKSSGKIKRIWPMRLIVAVAAVIICWSGGIYWVFRPQPTAQEIITTVAALNPARVITVEPGQVFFQLPIDPIYQQRWVRSLGMDSIPTGTFIPIPHHHTLDTWTHASAFVRPPYAEVEVREWWKLRLRKVTFGFSMTWEDGSILLLDLESDMLIGWMRAKHIPEILN